MNSISAYYDMPDMIIYNRQVIRLLSDIVVCPGKYLHHSQLLIGFILDYSLDYLFVVEMPVHKIEHFEIEGDPDCLDLEVDSLEGCHFYVEKNDYSDQYTNCN